MNMLRFISWAWRNSRYVAAGTGIRRFMQRVNFTKLAVLHRRDVAPFIEPPQGGALEAEIALRPEIVGVIAWPYICNSWGADRRISNVIKHYEVIDELRGRFTFSAPSSFELLDLNDLLPGLHIIVDRPQWFIREGQLAINLFSYQDRIFSLAFSLGVEADERVAYIGAIQGVQRDGMLEKYKEFTKILFGMRPRDFLIEVFRMLVQSLGVVRILAVRDASRHHRSSFFNASKAELLLANYDEVWIERGGVPHGDDFFCLRVNPTLKNIDDVPSKKRTMYRRRYEMLATLSSRLRAGITGTHNGSARAATPNGTFPSVPPSDRASADNSETRPVSDK
ncbi:VirK/YbjX family protein [Sulfuricaulis sp.]|jgi:uncharacterized protein VirK/YbjX|uniref:VirK/YbjX family protein n=1 Tax=Sulfuricaulis sp. TaxID=2003553 RepID=UPI0035597F71